MAGGRWERSMMLREGSKKKKQIKRKNLLFPLVYEENARAYFQGEINSWCKLKIKRPSPRLNLAHGQLQEVSQRKLPGRGGASKLKPRLDHTSTFVSDG